MSAKRPPNRVEHTPSGIEIEYWDAVGVDGKPQMRRYKVEGEKYVAITTVSGIYEKWGLTPAAVKLTEEGVIALAKDGVDLAQLTPAELRALMIERGLYFDSIWDKARQRGDVAHDHLLHLIRDGKVAKLQDYPADQRAWIQAGMRYVRAVKPKPIACEYIVASVEHRFAGRPDLFAELRDGRKARIEFKTVTEWKVEKDSKGNKTDQLLPPYDENLIQLAGQEIASVESGYEPSDYQMVVRLGPDGDYDVTECHATPEAFLAALTSYRERGYLRKPRPEAVPA